MRLTVCFIDAQKIFGRSRIFKSLYKNPKKIEYKQSTTDASTDFFFDYIPKGTYVFEYPLLVNAAGDYANGITTIQCMYAPEFSAHSEGIRVIVTK